MRPFRLIAVTLLALALPRPVVAASKMPALDPANFDTTCAPCRDFYQYANGGWLKRTTIPGAYASWGSFEELAERNQDDTYRILERARTDGKAKPGSDEWKLGVYYGTCMDSSAAEAQGTKPIEPLLLAIDGMKSNADLPAQVAWLHAHGVGGMFAFRAAQDPKHSDEVIAFAAQGGLGLPDRDYYVKEDSASRATRVAYVDHIARSFVLLGRGPAESRAEAERVLAIETGMAKASMTNVQRRDPKATYHKMPFDSLRLLAPAFHWSAYVAALPHAPLDSVNVQQPEFFRALDGWVGAVPLADWQAYLRWKVLDDAEAVLNTAFVQEDFRFQQVLTGATELRPRWKRCIEETDDNLGDLLGQSYVQEHFPPAARERALRMVRNLEAALGDRLVELEWMGPETRRAAAIKLEAFANKIGYPDKWRDYAGVSPARGPFLANRLGARAAEVKRNFNKIGKPVDRGEWNMTPPTVNAYYSSSLNSINFPAGILQPPFYDPDWDDASNYGAIGSVIGHEMSHGFDDRGRQFDSKGNLRDWWSAEDATRFRERAQKVVEQFDGYVAVDTLHVNGRLTLGENIADLGGIALAYAALQKELAGKPRPMRDGFTPEQRFFLAYAQEWRGLTRPERQRTLVNTDPHSPDRWRVNGPLSNLPEFAQAFGCKDGDAMVRRQEQRARIW